MALGVERRQSLWREFRGGTVWMGEGSKVPSLDNYGLQARVFTKNLDRGTLASLEIAWGHITV